MVYNCCAHCSVYMKILWQLNWTCLNSVQWFCWEITFVQKMFNGKSTHEMILMPYEICLLWDKLKKTITDLNSCLNCIGFGWNSPKRFILFGEKTLRKRENTNYCAAVEMFLLLVICHQDCIKFNSFVKMMAFYLVDVTVLWAEFDSNFGTWASLTAESVFILQTMEMR